MRTKGFLTVVVSLLLITSPVFSTEQATVVLIPHTPLKKLTGFTYPREEMTVTSEVSGRCLAIMADIGNVIPDSGVMATIDPTFIELEIADNRIARERVQRQLADEERSLRRYSKLLSEQSTPQARLDEVALAADLHRLELKGLENVGKRLEEQLQRHTIPAPPGWKVVERYATEGEYLQAGSGVAKLGDFRSLLIPFAFSSEELQLIRKLPELKVYLPEVNAALPASIYRISPVLDPVTRKITVDLLLENNRLFSGEPLRGGMRVEFSFADEMQQGVYEIPSAAVISRYEASWIMRPDGERVQVINLGEAAAKGNSLITADQLKAGQRFLADPDQARAPGQE